MGDININHLKDVDAAEQNFLTILQTEPDNVQANHNLCVVYVERGDLYRAEKCLVAAVQLAPHEEYIQQHLQIVRTRIRKAQEVCTLYAACTELCTVRLCTVSHFVRPCKTHRVPCRVVIGHIVTLVASEDIQ